MRRNKLLDAMAILQDFCNKQGVCEECPFGMNNIASNNISCALAIMPFEFDICRTKECLEIMGGEE